MAEITRNDHILGLMAAGEHPRLAGLDLSGLDLSHLDLHGANLDGADLSECTLHRADLTGSTSRPPI